MIGKFDAVTGAAINANFIVGLTTPTFIAVSAMNLAPPSISDNVLTYYYTGGWFRVSYNSNGSGTNEDSDGDLENITYTYNATGNTAVIYTTALTYSETTTLNYTSSSGGSFTYQLYEGGVQTMDLDGTFTASGNQFSLVFSSVIPPTVTTLPATNVTAISATLYGTVNPNGIPTTAQFEYGLTTAYGSMASVTLSPDNGTAAQDVSTAISSLQGGRTYHYRLTATNAGGTTPGSDQTLTTPVPPVAPGELIAPKIEIVGSNIEFTVQQTVFGRRYQLQQSETMLPGTWVDVGTVQVGDGNLLVIPIPYDAAVPKRFHRLVLDPDPTPPGFALIQAGVFQMGDQSNPLVGNLDEVPVHSVYVSAFYMGKYEVTKELWDAVRAWGLDNGYTDLSTGNGSNASKGANHPVHSITWYDMVKWCNARSQKEGLVPCYTVSGVTYQTGDSAPDCNWSANGYRLPTEAEWEKAARGGLSGKNFPWGDTITHSQANYASTSIDAYDVSPTGGYHPTYAVDGEPYSSPVGSFAPNGYGLYDMAGNMYEWCWDRYGTYTADSQVDPAGAASGYLSSTRVLRGGGWFGGASDCRAAARNYYYGSPGGFHYFIGFRLARSLAP